MVNYESPILGPTVVRWVRMEEAQYQQWLTQQQRIATLEAALPTLLLALELIRNQAEPGSAEHDWANAALTNADVVALATLLATRAGADAEVQT